MMGHNNNMTHDNKEYGMVSSQQHDNKLDTPTSVDNSNIINSSPTTNETQWSEAVSCRPLMIAIDDG